MQQGDAEATHRRERAVNGTIRLDESDRRDLTGRYTFLSEIRRICFLRAALWQPGCNGVPRSIIRRGE
jgi:hypothetical protein